MALPVRRSYLKGKMRRKMMRQGMPRSLANESANVYTNFLREFSSIKEIRSTVNQFRKIEEKDEEASSNVIVENKNTIPAI